MPYFESHDGTRLHYKDWGRGRPLVFLHGWSMSSDMWEYQLPWLVDQGLRCVALDRRGCGRSDEPGGGYDYDTLAGDVAALIEHLDLRDLTLVGYSMGGGEITRYLSRHGTDRVRSTVLIGTITPFVPNPAIEQVVSALRTDRPAFLHAGVPGFFRREVSPGIVQWVVDQMMEGSPLGAAECLRANAATDFGPELSAFTVPTLVVAADADESVPIDITARPTAAAIPGSQLVVIPGAGHAMFVTEHEWLNKELLAFCAP